MSANPFTPPAPPGSGITWQDLSGALLLVRPMSVESGIKTAYGEADAVRADVIVLDGPQAGTEYLSTLVFPKLLANQLSRSLHQQVLGRLTQGAAKPGQSPPWLLSEATPQDVQVGQAYLASQVQQPAPAAAPAGGWQQPVQQQAAPATQPVQQGGTVPF